MINRKVSIYRNFLSPRFGDVSGSKYALLSCYAYCTSQHFRGAVNT